MAQQIPMVFMSFLDQIGMIGLAAFSPLVLSMAAPVVQAIGAEHATKFTGMVHSVTINSVEFKGSDLVGPLFGPPFDRNGSHGHCGRSVYE